MTQRRNRCQFILIPGEKKSGRGQFLLRGFCTRKGPGSKRLVPTAYSVRGSWRCFSV
jgi:hypothetical protein